MGSTKVMFCRDLIVPQRARHSQASSGVLFSGVWSWQLEGYSSGIFHSYDLPLLFYLDSCTSPCFSDQAHIPTQKYIFSKAFLHCQGTSVVQHDYFSNVLIHFLVNFPLKFTRFPRALKLKKLQKYFFQREKEKPCNLYLNILMVKKVAKFVTLVMSLVGFFLFFHSTQCGMLTLGWPDLQNKLLPFLFDHPSQQQF